jgi:hypothetical protein
MSTFKLQQLDGRLAVIDADGNVEWVEIDIFAGWSTQEAAVRIRVVDLKDSNLAVSPKDLDDEDIARLRTDMQEWLDGNCVMPPHIRNRILTGDYALFKGVFADDCARAADLFGKEAEGAA